MCIDVKVMVEYETGGKQKHFNIARFVRLEYIFNGCRIHFAHHHPKITATDYQEMKKRVKVAREIWIKAQHIKKGIE